MIKLFSLKQEKKDGEQTSRGTQKKASAAQLRIQKGNKFLHAQQTSQSSTNANHMKFDCIFIFIELLDINDLNLPKTCTTDFPDPDDLLNFKLNICPDEGFYKGGRFVFNFKVCAIVCKCRCGRMYLINHFLLSLFP